MSQTEQIQNLVKAVAKERGFDLATADGYNAAFRAAKEQSPKLFAHTDDRSGRVTKASAGFRAFGGSAAAIQAAVKNMALQHNIDLATNEGHERAWNLTGFHHPGLFTTNDDLKGVTPSADGTQLTPGWPAPPERLKQLGLPLQTSEDAFRLFSLAEDTKLTPEIAAVVVRTLIQFSQIERALNFEEAMAHVSKHRPELYQSALQAARNRPSKS